MDGIVDVDVSDATPDAAPTAVFEVLMAAVQRGEVFAAVVRMPEVAAEGPPRGRRIATDDPGQARSWALARLESD
jgi:hypothetical protein